MAALRSIVFYNMDIKPSGNAKKGTHDLSDGSHERKTTPPACQWELTFFLTGLVQCAGYRHFLSLMGSGCVTSCGISTRRNHVKKARSFVDWSNGLDDASKLALRMSSLTRTKSSSHSRTISRKATVKSREK